MAPEQLEAFVAPELWHDVGPAADIFSLGLVLRELLVGRRPEPHDPNLPAAQAIRDLIRRRASADSAPRAAGNRAAQAVPHGLDAIIRKCLVDLPDARYPDAGSLAEDLRRYLARRPTRFVRNPSLRERTVVAARRHVRSIAAAMGIVAISALVAAAFSGSSGSLTPTAEWYIGQGRLANDDSRFTDARESYRKALELDPENAVALAGLGEAYFGEYQFEESRQAYSQAIDVRRRVAGPGPDQELSAWYDLRAISANTWAGSIQTNEWSPTKNPVAPASRINAVRRLYSDALDDLERAQVRAGNEPLLLFRIELERARALMGLGDVASVQDDYTNSTRLYREVSQIVDRLANQPLRSVKASEWARQVEMLRENLDLRLKNDTQKLESATPPAS